MRHRIGLVYLPGALPCFEAFGNLPTELINESGYLGGKPASEVLDMIIIPGGSLVESQTLKGKVAEEVKKMAKEGKFVLGICSGFQVLSNGTDIGRLSETPIFRKGLGLIDAEFSPLICTDQVKATVVGASFLTDAVGAEVTGFHCHTYGNIMLHKNARPIIISHVNRLNYHEDAKDVISGIANLKGNVVGIITHALLDRNPVIIEGIQKSLEINAEELVQIRAANAAMLKKIKNEMGVSTNIRVGKSTQKIQTPKMLLVTALGSGAGKTFIVTGLAGALKKSGLNVGVVKVGGDIRDVVPALYMIKEPIRSYASIRIGESGWKKQTEVVKEASKDYDFVIFEGAMSAFTGLFNEKVVRPSSTAEVAASLGVPTVVVVSCDKEGVEGALVSTLSYVRMLKNLKVKTVGVILNKVRISYLTDNLRDQIKQAFEEAGVDLLGIVPRIDLEGRGAIPEIEIKYEEFGTKALESVEASIDLKRIAAVAAPPQEVQVDYEALVAKFRKLLIPEFKLTQPKERKLHARGPEN